MSFDLTLALDDRLEKDLDLSVVDSVLFILPKLEVDRQPLQLELSDMSLSPGRVVASNPKLFQAGTSTFFSRAFLYVIVVFPVW